MGGGGWVGSQKAGVLVLPIMAFMVLTLLVLLVVIKHNHNINRV